MSPLASYRRLLHVAGPTYVVVAFLGRLPLAMSQLGTLMLVAAATGSYGAGGLAAGALAVGNAVGSPAAGALADRIGQRPVVLVQSLVGALGLTVLVVLTDTGAGVTTLVTTAALTGLALPQVGPLARVRWRPLTDSEVEHQRQLLDAAFSYEGAADEASFVLGPALVGLGAVAFSPSGSLLAAAALLAVFGTGFALHSSSLLTGGLSALEGRGRLVTLTFVGLLLAQLSIGSLFGSIQTGTTVLATDAGEAGLAGLVHALLGVGSVVAGLATAALPARITQQQRVWASALALVALSAPLLLVDSLGTLMVTVIALGFAVAPYMIGVFSLGERVAPRERVSAAMTLLAAATGLGYALGSSLAGRLADLHGHTAAFGVTVGATVAALLLASGLVLRLRRPAPAP
ncbi:MAG: MFS transporter [Nocardioides sp.]|nr:MFS transporter [Nocardioides sp.]